MKHTKREWMPLYSFLDRKRVTDHLADMAARGWMLDRLGTWSWHYRRTEPKQLRFAVTFFAGAGRFSPAPAAGLDTFQDYCAQAGWHRAASSDQVQVFYSEDPAAVPIDTDPAAELENIRRSIGKPMIRNYLALLLLCLLEVAFQCYQIWTDPVDTLASPTALLAATAYLPLLVLTLASLLLYRRWQWRAEAAVEAGLPLPDLRSARGLGILVLMRVRPVENSSSTNTMAGLRSIQSASWSAQSRCSAAWLCSSRKRIQSPSNASRVVWT